MSLVFLMLIWLIVRVLPRMLGYGVQSIVWKYLFGSSCKLCHFHLCLRCSTPRPPLRSSDSIDISSVSIKEPSKTFRSPPTASDFRFLQTYPFLHFSMESVSSLQLRSCHPALPTLLAALSLSHTRTHAHTPLPKAFGEALAFLLFELGTN